MRGLSPGRQTDVAPWQWPLALVLVAAVHAYVAERLGDPGPVGTPPAEVRLIEVSLLPPAPLPEPEPAGEPLESPPPVPEPEPPAPPEPVTQSTAAPKPPPARPSKVVPKRAVKAGPRGKPVAEAARRPGTASGTKAETLGPAPAAPRPTAPRHDVAYLNNPPPRYPAAARRRGLEGRVLVHALVSAAGACARAEVRRSSGHPVLDEAALRAVRGWRFVPATREGRAVEAGVEIPIVFRLEE